MRVIPEPLAFQILRRHLEGEPVHKLAEELGIPVERVRQRLVAAALVWGRRPVVPSRPNLAQRWEVSPN